MNDHQRRKAGTPFLTTIGNVLPTHHDLSRADQENLLVHTEQEAAHERFLRWNFSRVSFPISLYDNTGKCLIHDFLAPAQSAFPARIDLPERHAAGSYFLVAEGRLFFLYDHLERWPDTPPGAAVLAVELPRDRILGLAHDAPDSQPFTQSEYLLLAHLLCGLDLRAVAKAVGTSYDTKRKQVQVLLAKLNAKSQNAMLRSLSIDITSHLLETILPRQERERESALVRQQFGRDVAINNLTIGDELEVPLWEFGDRDGQPVLYFHSMLCPTIFRDNFIRLLKRDKIRWLVVPRHFLGAGQAQNLSQRMDRISRAVHATLRHLGIRSVVCLGESAGVSWALHFSRKNPDIVRHLKLVSTPLPAHAWPKYQTQSLYSELSLRVRRSPQVITGLARIYNTLARNPGLARRGLTYLYRNAPADLAVLRDLFQTPTFAEWLKLIANEASMSSMDEFQTLGRNWPADFAHLQCGVSFVHGAQDPFFPATDIERFARTVPNARFEMVADAGHLALERCLPQLLGNISGLLTDHSQGAVQNR